MRDSRDIAFARADRLLQTARDQIGGAVFAAQRGDYDAAERARRAIASVDLARERLAKFRDEMIEIGRESARKSRPAPPD